jgi:hypothetical protein
LVQNSGCGLSGEVVGTYDVDDSFIKVKGDGQLPQEILEICAHEVGHYVWYEYLSEADRAEYEAIYNDSSETVSVYAAKRPGIDGSVRQRVSVRDNQVQQRLPGTVRIRIKKVDVKFEDHGGPQG